MLTNKELKRYNRHILLSEIGVSGQERLKQASVLVIGAGGLGCPVLQYLTAAGVGRIGVIDFDKVDESNLQRQVLYTTTDVGKYKVDCAVSLLQEQNPHVTFDKYAEQLSTKNALKIIEKYDIVVDGTDNFPTRYLINDACVLLGKVLIYGSINKFEGQVSVFNLLNNTGDRGPTYRCLFPTSPTADEVPNCSEAGVLGVLPGIIGSMQANEVIKVITEIGDVLSGKLFMLNALTMHSYTVSFDREVKEGGILSAEQFAESDYDLFCNGTSAGSDKEITADALYLLLENERERIQLIDVREEDEQPVVDELVELSIPLDDILENADQLDRSKKIILYCRTGSRSSNALLQLQKEKALTNLYSLKGGVIAWLNND